MLPALNYIQFLIFPVIILQLSLHFSGHEGLLDFISIGYTGILAILLSITTKLKGRFHKRVCSGLLASMLGMIYFTFIQERNTALASSMVFFLLPQIFYINAFYLDFKSAQALDKAGARIAIAFAFVVSIAYYMLLRKDLGILKIPVMVGVFMTSLLFMMAAFRNLRVNTQSFRLILIGVICYMVAEGIYAYHSFVHEISTAEVIYSITFLSALHLIVLGTVSRKLIHTT